MVKVTFTLDTETVKTLRQSAERLQMPQSAVVRDAIADHAARIGRLSERERTDMLRVLDTLTARPSARTNAATDAEIRALRRSRRTAGHRRNRRA